MGVNSYMEKNVKNNSTTCILGELHCIMNRQSCCWRCFLGCDFHLVKYEGVQGMHKVCEWKKGLFSSLSCCLAKRERTEQLKKKNIGIFTKKAVRMYWETVKS